MGAAGEPPSVLFLHPDLGLGGAERLVVDAALAMQARGCRVQIWTAHYDTARCFAETRGLPVRRAGGWLPRSLWGRGHALCAALRMAFVALYVLLLSGERVDVFVCDQVRGRAGAARIGGGGEGRPEGRRGCRRAPGQLGGRGSRCRLASPPRAPVAVGLSGRRRLGEGSWRRRGRSKRAWTEGAQLDGLLEGRGRWHLACTGLAPLGVWL